MPRNDQHTHWMDSMPSSRAQKRMGAKARNKAKRIAKKHTKNYNNARIYQAEFSVPLPITKEGWRGLPATSRDVGDCIKHFLNNTLIETVKTFTPIPFVFNTE